MQTVLRKARWMPMNAKTPSRAQLMQWINETSFAVDDLLLYLDSHPDDEQALDCYREYVRMRKDAVNEYARCYAPLTIDTADEQKDCSWQWVSQPWPWEKKGGCR